MMSLRPGDVPYEPPPRTNDDAEHTGDVIYLFVISLLVTTPTSASLA